MKDYELDRHLQSKKYDITAAAHSVLKDWRNSQRDNVIAYSNLCAVLRQIEMQYFIDEVLTCTVDT